MPAYEYAKIEAEKNSRKNVRGVEEEGTAPVEQRGAVHDDEDDDDAARMGLPTSFTAGKKSEATTAFAFTNAKSKKKRRRKSANVKGSKGTKADEGQDLPWWIVQAGEELEACFNDDDDEEPEHEYEEEQKECVKDEQDERRRSKRQKGDEEH